MNKFECELERARRELPNTQTRQLASSSQEKAGSRQEWKKGSDREHNNHDGANLNA